jgi:uncharacterized protein YcaQ
MEKVRRLAVTKQHLAGEVPPSPTAEDILSVVRDLPYVQWDPVPAIAPSHIISLWSRLGSFRTSDLDALLWREKKLLQHWAPIAMIVPTEEYPLYASLMARYPESLTKSWGSQRARAKKFLAEHAALRKSILAQLGGGPLQLSQFKEHAKTKKKPDGWSSGSDVSTMLYHLQMGGEAMVVGHQGNQNVWGATEASLPGWADRTPLPEQEFERAAALRAIRALGTASPSEITFYFVRGRYQNLKRALDRLLDESVIRRVRVAELGDRDVRYISDQDVQLLQSMGSDAWQPRTTLIAPFDNLISGRARTNRLFGFDYAHEQFLPAEKRKFGTFVLPILSGERLIGRADVLMDRENRKLLVNSVHAEPGAPQDRQVSTKIGETMEELAGFLGAEAVTYTSRVPPAWKSSLR